MIIPLPAGAFAPPAMAATACRAGPGHAFQDSLGIDMNLGAGNVSSFEDSANLPKVTEV